MGWFNYHLWEFTIGKRRYGLPADEDWGTEPRIEASKVRLRDVLQPGKNVIDYLYDFGDSWEHRITITNIRRGEPGVFYPRHVAGEWNAPPEDCGGIPGFYALREVTLCREPLIMPRGLPLTPFRHARIIARSDCGPHRLICPPQPADLS